MRTHSKQTLAAGCRHSVVLQSDTTVRAVGDNKQGQCNTHDWVGIASVAAGNVHRASNTGSAHTVGLKVGSYTGGCWRQYLWSVSSQWNTRSTMMLTFNLNAKQRNSCHEHYR